MTTQRKRELATGAAAVFVKNWLPVIIFGATILWRGGRMEERMEANMRADAIHHSDPRLHMPYEEKIKVFTTREEWRHVHEQLQGMDSRQRQILITLTRLEGRMDNDTARQ